MKQLEDLWDEIPEKLLKADDISGALQRKSLSEVERIARLLKVELALFLVATVAFIFIQRNIDTAITYLFYSIAIFCTSLNLLTLNSIKKLQLVDDVGSFLKNALKVLKTFVAGFIASIQIVGVFMVSIVKMLDSKTYTWTAWIQSDQGISTLGLLLIIELALLYYAWVFYIKRIYALKGLISEMDPLPQDSAR